MPIDPDKFLNNQKEPDAYLYEWLSQSKSITEQLFEKTGEASIQLLNQGMVQTGWWEKHVLNLNDSDEIFVREILMSSQYNPCWYARTIIPYETYLSKYHLFQKLKSENLTKIIYETPNMRRTELLNYPVSQDTIEWYWVSKQIKDLNALLWARLATYQIQSKHEFYLLEVFLPALKEASYEP